MSSRAGRGTRGDLSMSGDAAAAAALRDIQASPLRPSSRSLGTTSSAVSRRRTGACWPPRASVSVCRIRRQTSEQEHLGHGQSERSSLGRRHESSTANQRERTSRLAAAHCRHRGIEGASERC
jgi:hypothetical protein